VPANSPKVFLSGSLFPHLLPHFPSFIPSLHTPSSSSAPSSSRPARSCCARLCSRIRSAAGLPTSTVCSSALKVGINEVFKLSFAHGPLGHRLCVWRQSGHRPDRPRQQYEQYQKHSQSCFFQIPEDQQQSTEPTEAVTQ
jgi:hypothetical protein